MKAWIVVAALALGGAACDNTDSATGDRRDLSGTRGAEDTPAVDAQQAAARDAATGAGSGSAAGGAPTQTDNVVTNTTTRRASAGPTTRPVN